MTLLNEQKHKRKNAVIHGIAKLEHRGKIKYKTEEEAMLRARLSENRLTLSFFALNVYECSFCDYWHVGHSVVAPNYETPVNNNALNAEIKRKKKTKRLITVTSEQKYKRQRKQYYRTYADSELTAMQQEKHHIT